MDYLNWWLVMCGPSDSKREGFTLFEVLISIVVLTTTVFLLTNLQIRSFLRIESDRDLINRIYLIKKELYTALLNIPELKTKIRKDIEEPAMRVTTCLQVPVEKSSLYAFREKIGLVIAQGVWDREKSKRKEEMVGLIACVPDDVK